MTEHPLDTSLRLGLQGRFEEAEEVLQAHKNDARALFNLGWYESRRGLWHNAAVYLDVGRTLQCYGSPPLRNGKSIWNEEPLHGKILHLRCEGGYGDEVIGVRWARHFADRGARVHVSCSPGLASLFARMESVTAVTTSGHNPAEFAQGADCVYCDYWVPAMSCSRWFEPTGEAYLKVDWLKKSRWYDKMFGPELRIGLRWAGNPKFEGQQYRKFPSELMLNLVSARPDAKFYSLQTGNDLVDLPPGVIDLTKGLTDWDETAAMISNLDLVVTSCTGVAHCAAALGVPTWVVVPVMPYNVWAMPGEKSPWYDSVRLFRQAEFGDWRAPFERVAEELKKVELFYGVESLRRPMEGLRHAG